MIALFNISYLLSTKAPTKTGSSGFARILSTEMTFIAYISSISTDFIALKILPFPFGDSTILSKNFIGSVSR